MYQKTLSVALMLVALAFLGSGFPGFATIDSTSFQCMDNSDCVYSVCCALAGQDTGVCAQLDECADIYAESAKGTEKTHMQRTATLEEEVERNYIAVVLGIILLLIIAIVSYVEWHQQKINPKKYKKTHSAVKKRKKRAKK